MNKEDRSLKRSRGRPRKHSPFDDLGSPPPYVEVDFGTASVAPEDLSCADLAHVLTELRRTAVSGSIQRAYRQGRNTANKDRRRAARSRRDQLLAPYAALLSHPSLSVNSMAKHIARREKSVSERTIRRYITACLKEGDG